MSRLGAGVRRDPVLAAYLVFAIALSAFDLLGPSRLQEPLLAYTGWVPSMSYFFSLYFVISALLTGNNRLRSMVLGLLVLQIAVGLIRWLVLDDPTTSRNPYLRVSVWRPLWTVALPLVWLVLLAVLKPRPTASITAVQANGRA